MIILVIFAFLAGVVTVLSPCILPILPLILSSSIGNENVGKSRPLGVVVGFVLSFTAFTLFLSSLVRLTGISADALRLVSVVIIALFGFSLLWPRLQAFLERLFSRLSSLVPTRTSGDQKKGFGSGVVIGLSLGLLWTPCVGPILASVISLALTGSVSFAAALITLAYALGTAIPMLLVMWGGRELLQKVPWLLRNTQNIQRAFGVLMILTALAIFTNLDRKFQTYIISTFPEYGTGLTKLEDRNIVREALDTLGGEAAEQNVGKPLFDMREPQGVPAPELIPGGVWINSEPLSLEALRGKVVIVDFWTYSCINCQRTFPYLKKWHEQYRDQGLVIIGVHAPEFEFEKSEKNVREAAEDFGLTYPIVQDNNFTTWRNYQNRYWPAKYFIDKDGRIRYSHFGEGAYDESERMIQALLAETGVQDLSREINNPKYANYARTPELYLGYGRLEHFSSPEKVAREKLASYSAPTKLPKNSVAYLGEWSVHEEYARPQSGAKLRLHFEAKEVFLVMRPHADDSAELRIQVEGVPEFLGEDAPEGLVRVDADRLYKIIRLPEPGQHHLEIEFLDANTEVYAFTFG